MFILLFSRVLDFFLGFCFSKGSSSEVVFPCFASLVFEKEFHGQQNQPLQRPSGTCSRFPMINAPMDMKTVKSTMDHAREGRKD